MGRDECCLNWNVYDTNINCEFYINDQMHAENK